MLKSIFIFSTANVEQGCCGPLLAPGSVHMQLRKRIYPRGVKFVLWCEFPPSLFPRSSHPGAISRLRHLCHRALPPPLLNSPERNFCNCRDEDCLTCDTGFGGCCYHYLDHEKNIGEGTHRAGVLRKQTRSHMPSVEMLLQETRGDHRGRKAVL